MKIEKFIRNRDKILNDFCELTEGTEVARLMNALIIFEAITNGDGTKVFNDKAIEAQKILIEVSIRTGMYRPTFNLDDLQ